MSKVALTRALSVEDGGHILYFYESDEAYIQNVTSFIELGVALDQHIILIDRQERYVRILQNLKCNTKYLHFIDSHEFYESYRDFNYDRVINNLDTIVQPYIRNETVVRLWGNVEVGHQENTYAQLEVYEGIADVTIREVGYTTVCSYDSRVTPTNVHLNLMKTHEYLMTDEQLVRSPLYKMSNRKNPAVFPSLTIQHNLESEVDLYKQKLDFVHVVSHEVRNPLTVIKAYASLLVQGENDEERRSKLHDITTYATVIDNEITHIINTEEMLTTDAVWQKTLTKIRPAFEQAVEIMEVKAVTQNISLIPAIQLDGTEIMLANLRGLKLIVTNLLSNAIKYSYEGQRVWLRIHKIMDTLVIVVADEGIGMSPQQQGKLFKKYEKMDHETAGQGVGLFMVKKLVEHFEGTIEVNSSTGEGSTFIIELPLRTGTAATCKTAPLIEPIAVK